MASKTTQNQNQITRWSVMLGVNPGYDNTVHFTPDLAIQKAIPFIRQRFSGYSEVGVAPAAAVYNRAWGCPDGGEVGVVLKGNIKGNMSEDQKEQIEESLAALMADLGQSTGTVEYELLSINGCDHRNSTYIQNEYEENVERSEDTLIKSSFTDNESGIHFHIRLCGDMEEIGNLLQNQMETVEDGEYTVTGVLTRENVAVCYKGTQNLVFAPDCNAYLDALNKVVETVQDYLCGDPVIDVSSVGDEINDVPNKPLLSDGTEDFDPGDDL